MGVSKFSPASQRGVDATPTASSTNLVESGGVKSAINNLRMAQSTTYTTYFKGNGIVIATLALKPTSSGDVVLQGELPDGYRPPATFNIMVIDANGATKLAEVRSSGNVAIYGAVANTYYYATVTYPTNS